MKALLTAIILSTIALSQEKESLPVAVVLSLTGNATANAKPLHVLDWIEADAHIQVRANSKLSIVFENGRQFELDGGARATSQPTGLTAASGPIREGKILPPIPNRRLFGILRPLFRVRRGCAEARMSRIFIRTVRLPWLRA
jgi:hypothetical protein